MRTQPYREFWFKWHFWSGLIGGTVALFWAFSGYISTNPNKIFSPNTATKAEIAKYLGDQLPITMRDWQPVLPLNFATASDESEIVELNWMKLGDASVLVALSRSGQRLVQMTDEAQSQFSNETILAAVAHMTANKAVKQQEIQKDYDSYYYPRHHQNALDKPLPVVLVTLADEVGTQLYIDPLDGKLLAKLDRSARVYRWLYSALHHWDFAWLHYRPLWDIWMLIWVGFGLVLGGSSLVLGWRLLVKTLVKKKSPAIVALPEDSYIPENVST